MAAPPVRNEPDLPPAAEDDMPATETEALAAVASALARVLAVRKVEAEMAGGRT